MQYIPPIGKAGEAAYVDGDPAANIEGDPVSAKAWEHPMREVLAVIEGAGLTPDGTDLTQLYQAVQVMITGAVDTPRWLVMHETSVLSIPSDVDTLLSNLTLQSSNLGDTALVSGGFQVGAGDAGVWSITARANVAGGSNEKIALYRNGVQIIHEWHSGSSQVPSVSLVYPLAAGDTVQLYFQHQTGVGQSTNSGFLSAARISGL